MNGEDRLREALHVRLDPLTPPAPSEELLEARIGAARGRRRRTVRTSLLVAVLAFATASVGLVRLAVLGEDEEVTPAWTPPSPLPEGLRVELVAPARVRTAEVFDLRIRVTDDRGALVRHEVRFGDAPEGGPVAYDLDCVQTMGEEPSEPPTARELVEQWSYRAPGTYVIEAQAITGGCFAKSENITASTSITVEPGATPSNGPLPPRAGIGHESLVEEWMVEDHGYEADRLGELAMGVFGSDPDGFVSLVEVDWGDGSTPEVFERSLSACTDSMSRWPYLQNNFSVHRTTAEPGRAHPELSHRYTEDGIYTVRVRVVSVGCDGNDPQEATHERRVSLPPPPGGGGYEPDPVERN